MDELFSQITVILAQSEWSIAKDIGPICKRCNSRHWHTFFIVVNVFVFNIGSMEASVFMLKNYLANLHSFKNTRRDLTLKQMFGSPEKLTVGQPNDSNKLERFFMDTIISGQWWRNHQSLACKGVCFFGTSWRGSKFSWQYFLLNHCNVVAQLDGNFTRDEWSHLFCMFNFSHFSSINSIEAMSKRTEDAGEERVTLESKADDEYGITTPREATWRACFDCIGKPGENRVWKSERTSELVDCAANKYGETRIGR